jgi:ribosomal protein RSM22 (predicted rRNA methylase)
MRAATGPDYCISAGRTQAHGIAAAASASPGTLGPWHIGRCEWKLVAPCSYPHDCPLTVPTVQAWQRLSFESVR